MRIFLFTIASIFCFSCTHSPPTVEKSLPGPDSRETLSVPSTPEEQLEYVNNRLKQLEESAKKSGQAAVDYLASDLFLKADRASLEGDSLSAMLLYSHLINLVPNDRFIQRKYAFELVQQGQFKTAQKILESIWSEGKKRDEKTGLLLSSVYYAQKDSLKAKQLLAELIKENPLNIESTLLLSEIYYKEGKIDLAITSIQNGKDNLKKIPSSSPIKNELLVHYLYSEGKLWQEKKSMLKAVQLWQKALTIYPDHFLSTLSLGKYYEDREQYSHAYNIYLQFLNHVPSNPLVLNRIIQTIFLLGDYPKAIPYLKTLAYIDPEDLNTPLKLAILYLDKGEIQEALVLFHYLYEKVPTSDKMRFYLGLSYRESGEFIKSNRYFEQINNDSEFFIESRLQLAQNYATLSKNDPKQYEDRFYQFIDEAIKHSPTHQLPLQIFKVSYLEGQGDLPRAIKLLESLQQLEGFNEDHRYYLASLYERLKKYDLAYKIIEEIVTKNPKNAHAWNFWGYSLIDRGVHYDKAYNYIQKALILKPHDGLIRDSLGWYYFKMGKHKEALLEIQKAYKALSEDGVISKHLAIVYHVLKDFERAEFFYRKALEQNIEPKEQNEIKQLLELAIQKRNFNTLSTSTLVDGQ